MRRSNRLRKILPVDVPQGSKKSFLGTAVSLCEGFKPCPCFLAAGIVLIHAGAGCADVAGLACVSLDCFHVGIAEGAYD